MEECSVQSTLYEYLRRMRTSLSSICDSSDWRELHIPETLPLWSWGMNEWRHSWQVLPPATATVANISIKMRSIYLLSASQEMMLTVRSGVKSLSRRPRFDFLPFRVVLRPLRTFLPRSRSSALVNKFNVKGEISAADQRLVEQTPTWPSISCSRLLTNA